MRITTELATALAGRYEVEREVGRGGMAVVYLARDKKHDRLVALKVLNPELAASLGAERFLAEIRTTATLQHPNLLPLFDSGEANGLLYYVMPYMEGESLRARLEREQQLPVEEAVRIATGIANALSYAHSHGVIHRDLKPENVLLQHGQPVVLDFGIALALRNAAEGRKTQTGISVGTPQYMSPEQAAGEKVIDARADIYALGTLTYEMLAGEPPHTGPSAQVIISRVMSGDVRPVTLPRPSVPAHVANAVHKALSRVPADRFSSADAFARALENPAVHPTVTQPVPAPAALPAPPASRRERIAWAAGGLTLGVLGAVLMAGQFRADTPAPPVARLTVPLPGVTLRSDNSPAISLDGSMLAFPGVDSTRTVRFYTRSLDNESPLSVAGDRWDPNTAFFSPDGKWIGFLQGQKLRKVAIAGGAISIIADVPGAWMLGSWGTRDTIVYGRLGDLYTVAAAGGTPRLLVARDTTVIRYGAPHFLPDGRRFLAERVTAEGPQLVTGAIDDATVRELSIRGQSPHYVNGGWLVYVEPNGRAVAAPFDERGLRVIGPAIPVAENVFIDIHARFTVSRNGAIAYYTARPASNREVVLVEPGGVETVLPLTPGRFRFPRFSPDGKRIALVTTTTADNSSRGDVWTYDLTTRRSERLTFDSTAFAVEWAPDGRSLVYVSRPGRGDSTTVTRISATSGGQPERIRDRARVFDAVVTPDNQSIIYRERNGQDLNLTIAPLSAPSQTRPLAATMFAEGAPAVSPNGEWMAYASNQSGSFDVYVQRVRGGGERWRVSSSGGAEPRWAANGTTLLYRQRDTVFAVPLELGADAQVGDSRPVFAGAYVNASPFRGDITYDVTRDGKRFIMLRDLDRTAGTTLHLVLNWFANARDRAR